jgi:putative transcriptional regulator
LFVPNKKKFKTDAYEAIYEAARGLHKAGTIDDVAMREFDRSCSAGPSLDPPKQIKRIDAADEQA